MLDKERFHNTMALYLGYERIVKDKRITIDVDDSDDPCVTLKFQNCPEVIRFKASENNDTVAEQIPFMQDEIKVIADAVQKAYIQATSSPF